MPGSYRACFPVFSYFSKISLFSCFFSCFLQFVLFFCYLFQVKILNFQVFSYTGFLQILENLENLEKSTNFIKVRDFFYTEGCVHVLSFIFKNDFFSSLFSCLFSVCMPYWKNLFEGIILSLLASLDNCFSWLNEISILVFTLFSISLL